MVETLIIGRGHIVVVSAEDADLEQRQWYLNTNGYAMSYVLGSAKRIDGRMQGSKQETLHEVVLRRFLGQRPPGMFCDHVNGRKWDNRRENLRYVNALQNTWNTAKRGNTLFKGVYRMKIQYKDGQPRYTASLCGRHLGVFRTPEAAARAFDQAALTAGRAGYERLNFPETAHA